MVMMASDFGWRVSIVVRGIWAVPESAMASFSVAYAVSTVVRMVDEKYFGIFITKFQTYKIHMKFSKILKFSSTCLVFQKIFSIWIQTYHGVIKRHTDTSRPLISVNNHPRTLRHSPNTLHNYRGHQNHPEATLQNLPSSLQKLPTSL